MIKLFFLEEAKIFDSDDDRFDFDE